MTRSVPFLVALTLAWSATPGAELSHVVQPGESASAIAQRYYGDHDTAELLLLYNGRRDPVIRPGESLRVPYCEVHRVRPGDTGSTLANRYLGRPSSWPAIATLNDLDPGAPLRVGQEIDVPVVLSYALMRRETLALVAKRFYGDTRQGTMLQSFNGIDDPRNLSVGQTIQVPLIGLRKVAPAPAKVAKKQPAPATRPAPPAPPKTPAWFEDGIEIAQRAFERGDYARAEEALASLIARASELRRDDDRERLWRMQAFVDIAFDRTTEACEAVRAMPNAGGNPDLDPVQVSPKIRDAIAACRDNG